MPVILNKSYLNLVVLISAVSLGASIGNVIFSPISLVGLRDIAPVIGIFISPYVGAAALSLLLLGLGGFVGFLIRLILVFLSTRNSNLKTDKDLLKYSLCSSSMGVVLAVWYVLSLYF